MADWARKVLKFTEKSAQILIDQDCNGQTLLDISSLDELKNFNLPLGAAIRMWAEIEKMKKAQADSGKQRILALTINESAFIGLRTALII